MKKFILPIAVISACSMLPSCSSDDAEDDSNKSITLRNHTESGCKDISSASNTSQFDGQALRTQKYMDSTERVSLKGNSKGTLNVFHENATFTCEAKFNITVNVSGNTIVVCEDAPPSTNCICLYDLTSEVGPLENKAYTLVIKDNNANVCTHQFHYSNTLDESFEITMGSN